MLLPDFYDRFMLVGVGMATFVGGGKEILGVRREGGILRGVTTTTAEGGKQQKRDTVWLCNKSTHREANFVA